MSQDLTDVRRPSSATAPDAGSPPAVLAGWWRRLGAYVVDAAVFIVVVGAAYLLGGAIFGEDADGEMSGGAVLLVMLAYLGMLLVYAPLLMGRVGGRNGQTLGKQALGIRVVRETGEPMSYGSGFVREILVKQLLGGITAGVFTVVSCLWPLWDRRNQALHDKMCGTLVVRVGS